MLKNTIKKLEKKNIAFSILLIILAILLIWKPIGFIKSIVIFIGVVVFILGLIDIISYVNQDKEIKTFSAGLFKGVIELIAGIFLIFRSDVLLDLFPVILGIIIIFNNIFKMQVSLNLKSVNDKEWVYGFAMSILCILLGVVIIMNPFNSLKLVVMVAGIIILVSEILSIIYSAFVLHGIGAVEEAVSETKIEDKKDKGKGPIIDAKIEELTSKKNKKKKKN